MIPRGDGRDAGHIALSPASRGRRHHPHPRIAYTIENVAAHIERCGSGAAIFALVVVAEAVKDTLGQQVRQRAGTRRPDLWRHWPPARRGDHADHRRGNPAFYRSRGGQCPARRPPNWSDRLIASAFGVHAVDLVAEDGSTAMVAAEPPGRRRGTVRGDRRAADVDRNGTFDPTARSLNICFGDD